jgi:hypothetical protein
MMKITTDEVGSIEGITEKIGRGRKAGLTYETIEDLKGVEQLDRLNQDNAVVLVRADSGSANLQTVPLP